MTVIPPATAFATTSQNCDQASRVTVRSCGFCRRAATIAQPTAAMSAPVSIRLVNSMTPWMPSSGIGVSESGVQAGQLGQPSPEPVTRTIPPPRTIRMLATSAAVVPQRRARGPSVTRSASQPKGVNTAAFPRSDRDGQDSSGSSPTAMNTSVR